MMLANALALGVQRPGGGGAPDPARYWDFTTGDYSYEPLYSRTGTKYVRNSSGQYEAFGTDVLPRTDLGAMFEPAGSGAMLHNATMTNSAWGKDAGTTVASLGAVGPLSGQNAYRATVASGNGRLSQNNVALVSGEVRRVIAICKPVDAFKFAYVRTDIAATLNSNRNYVFDLDLGIAKFQGGGSSNIVVLPLADGWYLIAFDLTAGFSGSGHNFYFGISNVEMTSNTFAAPSGAGAYDVAFLDHVKNGNDDSVSLSTTSAAARSEDDATLPLGGTPADLVFTFDDDTTQTFAAQSGNFAVPTNLNRPRVKRADWGSV